MHIILSNKIPDEIIKIISSYGEIILLPDCKDLPIPISHHPDSLIFQFHDRLFTIKGYNLSDYLKTDIQISEIDELAKPFYPYDTLVNGFVIKDYLICGKNISKNIIDNSNSKSLKIIKVNQGYAHCSSIVFKDSVITQDPGIFKKCQSESIDALLVKQGEINLPGYNTGFIGGCCCVIGNNIVFFGDIKNHPSYNEISLFVKNKGGIISYVENMTLTDFGGGVVIN